jgi:hypothetical protein
MLGGRCFSAVGRHLAIVLALLLAPRRPFLGIDRAVVVRVDLVKAGAKDRIAFPGRHRRQPIVIGLAPLQIRLFRRERLAAASCSVSLT